MNKQLSGEFHAISRIGVSRAYRANEGLVHVCLTARAEDGSRLAHLKLTPAQATELRDELTKQLTSTHRLNSVFVDAEVDYRSAFSDRASERPQSDEMKTSQIVDGPIQHYNPPIADHLQKVFVKNANHQGIILCLLGRMFSGPHSCIIAQQTSKKHNGFIVSAEQRVCYRSKEFSSGPERFKFVVSLFNHIGRGVYHSAVDVRYRENCSGVLRKNSICGVSAMFFGRETLLSDLRLHREPSDDRCYERNNSAKNAARESQPLFGRCCPISTPNRTGDAKPCQNRNKEHSPNGTRQSGVSIKIHHARLQYRLSVVEQEIIEQLSACQRPECDRC